MLTEPCAPAGTDVLASPETRGTRDEFLQDCLAGLTRRDKSLPCKWLYDDAGSALFDRICGLNDYYPYRTEEALIREAAPTVAALLAPATTLVELGSGASRKTRLLIEAAPAVTAYVPIDISAAELARTAARLRRDYRALDVRPLCVDFTVPGRLDDAFGDAPVLVFFPGSTLGNFGRHRALEFLSRLRTTVGAGGKLLLGIDVIKDQRTLLRAYDDRQGVTAAFNLNLLRRINRELGADIDIDNFFHLALWNEQRSCVEMHLVSHRDQAFRIGGVTIALTRGESIHTEDSFKLSKAALDALFDAAGWTRMRTWLSPHPAFLLALLAA